MALDLPGNDDGRDGAGDQRLAAGLGVLVGVDRCLMVASAGQRPLGLRGMADGQFLGMARRHVVLHRAGLARQNGHGHGDSKQHDAGDPQQLLAAQTQGAGRGRSDIGSPIGWGMAGACAMQPPFCEGSSSGGIARAPAPCWRGLPAGQRCGLGALVACGRSGGTLMSHAILSHRSDCVPGGSLHQPRLRGHRNAPP